jgi:hypothetical protein
VAAASDGRRDGDGEADGEGDGGRADLHRSGRLRCLSRGPSTRSVGGARRA